MSEWPLLARVEGVRSGRPCIRATGVLVEVLVDRFAAGESIVEIAQDYALPYDAVLMAIRFVSATAGHFSNRRIDRRAEKLLPIESYRKHLATEAQG